MVFFLLTETEDNALTYRRQLFALAPSIERWLLRNRLHESKSFDVLEQLVEFGSEFEVLLVQLN
jgi:hypothetical protein